MRVDRDSLIDSCRESKSKPGDFNCDAEIEHFMELLGTDLRDALADYEDPYFAGAGGSGMVISAIYKPFASRRAIKVPRRRIFAEMKAGTEVPEVDPELHALTKVSHQNITRLYSSHALGGGAAHCTVTEFVDDPKPLHLHALSLCCTANCKESRESLAAELRTLGRHIYELADAVLYMHEVATLLHFDLKPDNLLVSKSGHPFVTDLGFARDMSKYKPNESVRVGFTWKYAHPKKLQNDESRITQTHAKAKNLVKGADLTPAIDLFAFGRTIQEVLRIIEREYGDYIHSFYEFSFLHLVACLCLDGQNAANYRDDRQGDFVSDQPQKLPIPLFQAHRFHDFSQVKVALERLLGLRRVEDDIPELDRWSPNTINVSDIGITTLTPRVKSLINHPAYEHLAGRLQLGMLDTVFPTVSHNRMQHSIGVFHAATEYLTALYYDPENPTFRVLFREEDGKRVLLAALLHDIGQTTFGHEMEEVDEKLFSHAAIGQRIVESSTERDGRGRTLRTIIEGDQSDCWNIKVSEVASLLAGNSKRPIDAILADIIDGQLDADKLDYLIRDSVESRVRYGYGIDTNRFLRSLTTAGVSDGKEARLRLAIKRKGAASAEAFAFARYQLYQSLYWHHTFRAIKAMMLTATSHLIARMNPPNSLFDNPLLDAFLEAVVGLKFENTGPAKPARGQYDIPKLVKSKQVPEIRSRYATERALLFLWKLSEGRERQLIEDLMGRSYYKRSIEIPLGALEESAWLGLAKRFTGRSRVDLQKDVEDSLKKLLISSVQSKSQVRETERPDEVLAHIAEVESKKFAFIVDLPLRGWTASGDNPLFVSDYKRRHFGVDDGGEGRQEGAVLWSTQVGQMMRQIAFFRVFCEPRLHRILTRYVSPDNILSSLKECIPELRQLAR